MSLELRARVRTYSKQARLNLDVCRYPGDVAQVAHRTCLERILAELSRVFFFIVGHVQHKSRPSAGDYDKDAAGASRLSF